MKKINILVLAAIFLLAMTSIAIAQVDSPEDGEIYSEKKIPITINLGYGADYLQISFDGVRYKTLCRNCDSYDKIFYFGNKDYTLYFREIDDGEVNELDQITFSVDTAAPRIVRQAPRINSYVNSDTEFSVTYNEDNIDTVILYYKGLAEEDFTESPLVGCEEGTKKTCSTTVDLLSYDGEQIMYRFGITDLAGNVAEGPVTTVNADDSIPVLTIVQPEDMAELSAGRITLEVASDETLNIMQVMLDYSNKWITLCRKCDHYTKNIFIGTTGNHVISVRGTDNAGLESDEVTSEITLS